MTATTDPIAEIAHRYGAAVPPGLTITVIPRGQTTFVTPVWTGKALEYPQGGISWREQRFSLAGRKPPGHVVAAQARRPRVAELHAEGLTDAQIADRLGIQPRAVAADRRSLGLPGNNPHAAQRRTRRDLLRELVAQGFDRETIAERMGLSVGWLVKAAREYGVVLPQLPKAPRLRKPVAGASDAPPRSPRRATDPSAPRRLRGAPAAVLERRAEVARLHAEGVSLVDTAQRLGVSADTVRADRRVLRLTPNAADLARRGDALRANFEAARFARSAALLQRRQDVLARHAQGATLHEIAAEFGIRLRGVREILRPPAAPELGRRHRALSAAILAAHDAGATVEDIARAAGIDKRRAAGVLHRAGRVPVFAARSARAAKRQQLLDMVAQGLTPAQIADTWGCTIAAVWEYASRQRVSFRAGGERAEDWRSRASAATQGRRRKVAELRAQGLRLTEIAAALGVSKATVSSDITAAGLAGTSQHAPAARAMAARRPDLAAEAVVLHGQGLTSVEIGHRLGLAHWVVRRMIRAQAKQERAAA